MGEKWEIADDRRGARVLESFDAVVCCQSGAIQALSQARDLLLVPIRGQAEKIKRPPHLKSLKSALSFSKTLVPSGESLWLGASFGRNESSLEFKAQDRQENARVLGDWFPGVDLEYQGSFVGVRTSTLDTLPYVGRVPIKEFYDSEYSDLHFGKFESGQKVYGEAQYYPNLSVLAGLGSRGSTYSIAAASIVASQVLGRPLPVELEIWEALHPARFWIRGYRRSS